MFIKTIACLSLASIATAHFSIEYPEWRGDSFATGASQWLYPCANVNQTATTNRTLWPLTGGSLTLDLHHPWTYVFVNLGLGTDYPTFNISLTTQLLNETGNGTLCLPKMTLPASVTPTSGQNASIQVVTIGQTGSALYNCADITFSSNATILSGDSCANSTGVSITVVNQEVNGATTASAADSTSSTSMGSVNTSESMVGAVLVAGMGAVIMRWLL